MLWIVFHLVIFVSYSVPIFLFKDDEQVLTQRMKTLLSVLHVEQSSKLAGSPKSEASEIMLRTSETILALVRLD